MTNKRSLVAMALGTMLLASAAPGLALAQEEVEPFAAEGIEWQLESLFAEEGVTEVPEAISVTLFLSDGEVVGNAGCNSYFGAYEIDETSLTFADSFGATLVACQGPAQTIEDAYLPLLQVTAGWSIDEEGRLTLADAENVPTLVYREATVEITATDVDRLAAALSGLQEQIDAAEAEIVALTEDAASVNVNKLRDRIKANEQAIADLDKTVNKLRDRIKANEQAIVDINTTIDKFRNRIKALEATAEDHEARIIALEAGQPVPTPPVETPPAEG